MEESDRTVEASPFADPQKYVRIPRLGEITLSPDGTRMVAGVAEVDKDGGTFVSSLWALDPNGETAARRLTRSAKGESSAAFLPEGSLLFTSARPRPPARQGVTEADPDEGGGDEAGEASDDDQPALWLLPALGGDASVVATRSGGITGVATGRDSTTIIFTALVAPGSPSTKEDSSWWKARRKQKVSATLYTGLPVRHWDSYLGPHEVHIFTIDVDPVAGCPIGTARDLTPDAAQGLHESHPVLSADGAFVMTDWMATMDGGRARREVAVINVTSGERRLLASTEDGSYEYDRPAISRDGRSAAMLRTTRSTIAEPPISDIWLCDVATGEGSAIDIGDLPYPTEVSFSPNGASLLVVADCGGHAPLFRVEIATRTVTPLTAEGAWGSPHWAPDGTAVFASRSTIGGPPRPVRLDLAAEGDLTFIDAPGAVLPAGRVEEVTAAGEDGTPIRAWLVLPDRASDTAPVPLALVIHGGPLGSWNAWHWRWNPWLLAARGWAVLLPDPALSTGYGMQMIRRGWGEWGGSPYSDLMAITDAAIERPDIDRARTAALGGSYGGYMANWIAGHTDRFAAIVTHASIWALDQFAGTTDWPAFWADEWGYPDTNPEMYEKWSPNRFADAIRTPMLVIHGEQDYRCPVSESLRLWADLTRAGVQSQFLWFANENHWIVQPGDTIVWYEAVLAFLDAHVLGKEWQRPAML